MKSTVYKKTGNGKIEKIEKIDSSNVKTSESLLFEAYQELFDKINKGSKVVNYVKTKEYKDSLLDSLQDVMTKLIETKEYIGHNNPVGLLKLAFYNRNIDNFRKDSVYEIFKQDFSEYCQNREYGITKQYLHDMTMQIKEILSFQEYQIFKDYHIKGYTQKEIADKNSLEQNSISVILKKIGNKILGTDKREGLNLHCLVDYRYTSYNSKGKKRQHKRKKLTIKEVIQLSGKVRHIDKANYTKPIKIEKESIPQNKCLQYPTINYFPKEKYNHSYISGTDIQIEYISTLVYGKSSLPIEVKKYSSKEYRRKRYIRKYTRNLKHGINLKSHALFDGHKSYLYDDGIQK